MLVYFVSQVVLQLLHRLVGDSLLILAMLVYYFPWTVSFLHCYRLDPLLIVTLIQVILLMLVNFKVEVEQHLIFLIITVSFCIVSVEYTV